VEYLASRDAAEVAADTGDCTLEFAAASSALTLEQKVDKTKTAKIRVILNMMSPEIQKSLLPPWPSLRNVQLARQKGSSDQERNCPPASQIARVISDRWARGGSSGPFLQGNSHIPRYIAA
jgi:hypothetical protein